MSGAEETLRPLRRGRALRTSVALLNMSKVEAPPALRLGPREGVGSVVYAMSEFGSRCHVSTKWYREPIQRHPRCSLRTPLRTLAARADAPSGGSQIATLRRPWDKWSVPRDAKTCAGRLCMTAAPTIGRSGPLEGTVTRLPTQLPARLPRGMGGRSANGLAESRRPLFCRQQLISHGAGSHQMAGRTCAWSPVVAHGRDFTPGKRPSTAQHSTAQHIADRAT